MTAAPSTLHPRLEDPGVLAGLRAAWAAGGSAIRIESVLAPGLADALAGAALTRLPFVACHARTGAHTPCFFWRSVHELAGHARGERLEPPLDRAADLVLRDLPRLASALAGRPLALPVPVLGFCRYRKGSYLDAHLDEWDGARVTAFVVGLTRETWPEREGGHLTFLAEDRTSVLGARPPGWDTLDLYDTHPAPRWHAVPLQLTHHERVTLSGLMIEPALDPASGACAPGDLASGAAARADGASGDGAPGPTPRATPGATA